VVAAAEKPVGRYAKRGHEAALFGVSSKTRRRVKDKRITDLRKRSRSVRRLKRHGAAIVKETSADGASSVPIRGRRTRRTEIARAGAALGVPVITIEADAPDPRAGGKTCGEDGRTVADSTFLVINAGILIRGTEDTLRLEDFDRMLATTLLACRRDPSVLGSSHGLSKVITIGSNTAVRTAFRGQVSIPMDQGRAICVPFVRAYDRGWPSRDASKTSSRAYATDSPAAHAEMVKPLVPLGRMGQPEGSRLGRLSSQSPRRLSSRLQPDNRWGYVRVARRVNT